jgi:hypothetical protein
MTPTPPAKTPGAVHVALCSFSGAALRTTPAPDLAQRARKLLDRIGFLQQLETVTAVLRQHMAVATGQHYRQIEVKAADFPGKVDPGHAGHYHVRKHHVISGCIGGQRGQRIRGIADQRRDVAEVGQRVGREGSKMRPNCSFGMPAPVSAIDTAT